MLGLLYRSFFITLLLTILFLTTTNVNAQSAGSTTSVITGKVIDQQGALIEGAKITARNLQTNLIREIVSNEDGSYFLPQVPPGNYEIKIIAENFNTQTIPSIEVNLGRTLFIDISLMIKTSSDVIEVFSDSAVQEEGKTESSTNIGKDSINTLPINRRNFLDFSLTTPRVTRDRTPGVGVIASTGLSFNGQPARFNNITIDGLDNNETITGTVRATFSQEAVQEFQVTSDSFSAEFGRALGGVINIVTKGGTNDLKGNLFFLLRDEKISARDTFSQIKPEFKQYQFGTTVGGAIKKDKLFFFGSFERLSLKQSTIVTISDATKKAASNQGFFFDNGPVAVPTGTTSLLGRLDAKLNPNDLLFIRYNFSGSFDGALEPFGGLVAFTNSGAQTLTDSSLAITNTYISSLGSFINESRFLYGRRDQRLDPSDLGPRIQITAPEGEVLFGRAALLPQPRKENFYQFLNNITLPRGRNQIKLGADFIFVDPNQNETKVPVFAGGTAIFQGLNFADLLGMPGLPSFTALEALDPSLRSPQQIAFLKFVSTTLANSDPRFKGLQLDTLSLPIAYAQGFGDPRVKLGQKQFGTFVQFDFKATNNLLLKAGLRYDLVRTKFAPDNDGNFSPRLGVSYRITPNLNLNASYGIFFGTQPFGLSSLVQLTSVKKTFQIPVLTFPLSIIPFAQPSHKFPEGQNLPSGVDFVPQLAQAFQYDPNLRNGYSQQAKFSLDYFLTSRTNVALSYNLVRGIKIVSVRNINPIVRPLPSPLDSQLFGRIDPNQGDVFEFASAYDSYYNGVTLSFSQKFSKFNVLAHYTFSKTIDNFIDIASNQQESIDPLKLRDERGLSLQDVRSRFVLSGLVDLNAFNKKFFKDFQLSTILNLESGRPYNLLTGIDLNQSGDSPAGDRPIVNGASIGRNRGILPSFATLDLRIARSTAIKEQYKIQAIAEVFNLFNRVNISEINRIFPPGTMLPKQENGRFIAPQERYRRAFAPRQFQFGIRIEF